MSQFPIQPTSHPRIKVTRPKTVKRNGTQAYGAILKKCNHPLTSPVPTQSTLT